MPMLSSSMSLMMIQYDPNWFHCLIAAASIHPGVEGGKRPTILQRCPQAQEMGRKKEEEAAACSSAGEASCRSGSCSPSIVTKVLLLAGKVLA